MKRTICLLLVILMLATIGCARKKRTRTTEETILPTGEQIPDPAYDPDPWETETTQTPEPAHDPDPWEIETEDPSDPWETETEEPAAEPWETETDEPGDDPWETETDEPGDDPWETEPETPEPEPEPSYTVIDVPAVEQKTIAIDPITQNTTAIDKATIQIINGSISKKGQKDVYTLTAQYAGTYRLDFSGIQNGTNFEVYVRDENGDVIARSTYLKNNEGVTLEGLEAGTSYKISVEQDSNFSDYTLQIGMQKPTVDISAYTELTDSIEFKKQRNEYTFVPPIDGCYRFGVSNMMSGMSVEIYVLNTLNEVLERNTYAKNGEGVTARDLKAGTEYKLVIKFDNDLGEYILSIGRQKPTVDISDCTVFTDSTEFKNQRNVYTFTAPRDGYYRFTFSEMMNDVSVEFYVYDRLNEKIANNTYVRSGDGISIKEAIGGEQYRILIVQDDYYGSYKVSIGMQKETVSVGNRTIVHDSIDYEYQRNIYSFTATEDGDVTVTLSGFNSGVRFDLYAYNDYHETMASTTIRSNGDHMTIRDVTAGQHITIEVRQDSGLGSYEMQID